MRTILMSIKPTYSKRILAREKAYELRRTPVKMREGDLVVVYASSPVKAVVGAFTVAGVKRDVPERLWAEHAKEFGIEEADYRDYFAGAALGHAIEVGDVVEVEPVPLQLLRERIDGFRPPQSYQWWHGPLRDLMGPGVARVDSELLAK